MTQSSSPEPDDVAADQKSGPHGALETTSDLFEKVEHWITVGIGGVLVVATLLLLTGSLSDVWSDIRSWPETDGIFLVVDKLLFVLMLVEILHTVRASIQSSRLAVEPFLIVGLIATVRRMLIVTVESSPSAPTSHPKPPFEHAMIELGVLGGLTLVLIVPIYLARLSKQLITSDSGQQQSSR